ncbi:MAG: hypothetical protein ABGZ24_22820 [Fuerstiella sp.]|jgi:hypothetical protein
MRLVELGRVDEKWTASIRREIEKAESELNTWLITSMVLEILAERKTEYRGRIK